MRARTLTAAAICVVIAVLFVMALGTLDARGKRSRVYGERITVLRGGSIPVRTVRTSRELHDLLRELHVRGRVLVHASRYLQFVPIPDADVIPGGLYSEAPPLDIPGEYRKRLDHRNVLWVELQENVVREIYHLLPQEVFEQKVRSIASNDPEVLSIGAHRVLAHEWGARQTLSNRLPAYSEPVLLVVDASYFMSPGAPEAISALFAAGLAADHVIANLSEDNPDVSPESRRGLQALVDRLAAGG